jgi:oligopeptidase A
MIERLKRAKNFQSAMAMLRQLEFGLFDFELHSSLYSDTQVQNLLNRVREEVSVIVPPSYNKFQNSFSHIFAGGYAAGYYSYKWAEVLSSDAFLELIKSNFNKELVDAYKKSILYSGGSQSMQKLFKNFLKREPNVDNLLKISGIN